MNNADTAGPNNDGTALTVSGIVVEALPDTLFKVEIKDRESDPVLAYLSGKMRSSAPIRLQVFDSQGVVVKEMETNQAIFNLQKGDWPSGIYLFSITQEGRLVGSGKLAVR